MQEQLMQLRKLPDFYPLSESKLVTRAVEAYLLAQTEGLHSTTEALASIENLSLR
jgi:hypothetical protein